MRTGQVPAVDGSMASPFFYPQTCVIDSDVEIGADTVIEPFVQLLGKTQNRQRFPHPFLLA